METALIFKIMEFAIEHGIPAVQDLMRTYNKETVTEADWDQLIIGFEKSPEDYLKEADESS